MIPERLNVSTEQLRAFCQKWKIVEVDLFGSALGDDFTEESDVDLLVVYAEDAHTTLIDEGHILNELEELFGRPVDFVSKRAVENSRNPYRRRAILETATPIYIESLSL